MKKISFNQIVEKINDDLNTTFSLTDILKKVLTDGANWNSAGWGTTPYGTTYDYQLVEYLAIERNHSCIVANNELEALMFLKSVIERTSKKFSHMLKLYDQELDDIISLERTIAKTGETNQLTELTDEATIDTQLTKENETPDAGNIDLTTDTYVSHSRRTNVESDERKRNITDDRLTEEQLTERNSLEELKLTGIINQLIRDLYSDWMFVLDMEALTIELE